MWGGSLPALIRLEQVGLRGAAPGSVQSHLNLPSSSYINKQDPELSNSLPDATCSFSRNGCTRFSRVIIWFLLAKILKLLISVKVQLSGLEETDLSYDLGLGKSQSPFPGPDSTGVEMRQVSQTAMQFLPKRLGFLARNVLGASITPAQQQGRGGHYPNPCPCSLTPDKLLCMQTARSW